VSPAPHDLYALRAEGRLPTGQLAVVYDGVPGDALRDDGEVWALLVESFVLSRFCQTFGKLPDSMYWIVPGGDA
jgi:hypothetical protein